MVDIIIMIYWFLVNKAVNIVNDGLRCLVLVISVPHLEYHHEDEGDVGDDEDEDEDRDRDTIHMSDRHRHFLLHWLAFLPSHL